MPKRIQRKRTKGWRAPEGAVYVGRGSMWGNPFAVLPHRPPEAAVILFREYFEDARRCAMSSGQIDNIRREGGNPARFMAGSYLVGELRGKDLMCWCPDGKPCHADVLLEIANR